MQNREFIDSSDDVEKFEPEQNEMTVLDENVPSPAEIQTDETIVLPEIISMPEYIRRHYERDLIRACINQIYDLTLCVMYDDKLFHDVPGLGPIDSGEEEMILTDGPTPIEWGEPKSFPFDRNVYSATIRPIDGAITWILTNEKYKGDAILQKTYCTDYIRKTFVENDGSEIPKYYAENSHPAIVSAEVFDLVQMERAWRRSLSGHYSGKSCFSSRVVCGECGAFYGSKVWHSTDEYRRAVWRCNNKYGSDKKCSTPHVTQDELEKAFVAAMQELLVQKEAVFAACRTAIAETLDTAELDKIAAKLQDQALGMAERVRKLVEENARVRRDQEEYQREYNALASEHEKLSERIRAIAEQKRDKEERRRKIEIFLQILEDQNEYVRFDPYTFVALVDKVVVGENGELEFIFRNRMK